MIMDLHQAVINELKDEFEYLQDFKISLSEDPQLSNSIKYREEISAVTDRNDVLKINLNPYNAENLEWLKKELAAKNFNAWIDDGSFSDRLAFNARYGFNV